MLILTYSVLQILNEKNDPSDMNYTFITLVPKLPIPTVPAHFRPISLCNVTMKIATKCIRKRRRKEGLYGSQVRHGQGIRPNGVEISS